MRKARKPKGVKTEGFVLDGSVALAWCFPDEKAAYPQPVLDSLAGARAAVPSLWHLEAGNSLLVGERRRRERAGPVRRFDETVQRLLQAFAPLHMVMANVVHFPAIIRLDVQFRLGRG